MFPRPAAPSRLTNSANAFDIATLATAGSDDASLYDSIDLTVASATIGGTLNLTGGAALNQSGAIHAASLNATTTHGAITLTNAGNSFAIATVSTGGTDSASLTDAAALTIASANVGGTLTLAGASTIGQSGAIHAAALNVSTTGGAITLTNAANGFATASLSTTGSDNASLTDASALTITSATIGGTLTLTGANGIGQTGAIHAAGLNVTTTSGAITLTNTDNSFAVATLATGGSDNASLYDAANLVIASATIGGDLTLSGGGTIGQTGAIHAHTLNVTTTSGAITLTNSGNAFDIANVSTAGSDNASLYDASALTIASANIGGTLILTGGSTIGQTGAIHVAALSATTTNGAITLTNTGNSFNTATLATSGSDNATLYDASALTIAAANVGGTLALTGGSTLGQSGAILAAALNVTTHRWRDHADQFRQRFRPGHAADIRFG